MHPIATAMNKNVYEKSIYKLVLIAVLPLTTSELSYNIVDSNTNNPSANPTTLV